MTELSGKIKELRLRKSLTLKELSRLTSFSVSFLSMVERGMSSLSISSLAKIAEALGVNPSYFFSPPRVTAQVARLDQRQDFQLEGSRIVYNSLSGSLENKVLEPLIVTVPPGLKKSETLTYTHRGEEFGYVLKGALTMIIDGECYVLGPGDSIHFDSSVPHHWENRTTEPVQALWILTPRLFY